MSNRINKIKSTLSKGSAARSSKYVVYFSLPPEVTKSATLEEMSFMCKSATFPSVTIGQIEFWNQGRKLPIPGDTSYETLWTVTFYNDANHSIRRTFLAWQAGIDNFQSNTHSGNPGGLFVDMKVCQIDSLEKETAVYTFHNVWVQSVGEISVSADSVDQVQEFDITFSFSDFVIGENEFNEADKLKNVASTNVIAPNQ